MFYIEIFIVTKKNNNDKINIRTCLNYNIYNKFYYKLIFLYNFKFRLIDLFFLKFYIYYY